MKRPFAILMLLAAGFMLAIAVTTGFDFDVHTTSEEDWPIIVRARGTIIGWTAVKLLSPCIRYDDSGLAIYVLEELVGAHNLYIKKIKYPVETKQVPPTPPPTPPKLPPELLPDPSVRPPCDALYDVIAGQWEKQ